MSSIEPLAAPAESSTSGRNDGSESFYGSIRLLAWLTAATLILSAIPAGRAGAQCPDWIQTFGGLADVDGSVSALAVFDDGTGPALFAGGGFTEAGGNQASNIAKWDGATWSPVGGGLNGGVFTLTVFDDGTGPALYAGGLFSMAGDPPMSNVAKWDGAAWSPVGSGMDQAVYALADFDNGTGPALYAGGRFTTASGISVDHIARWDGTAWSPVGSGFNDNVYTLRVFDDGSGPALHAGGHFTSSGGSPVSHVAKWDGTSWLPLGGGLGSSFTDYPEVLTVFDDGTGPALYAGGTFRLASGQRVNHLAKWDGTTWSSVGGGLDDDVSDLMVFDDGSGPALYVSGNFTFAGDQATNGIARWDGASWSPVGSYTLHTFDAGPLAVFDDGSGGALYAGGRFELPGTRRDSRIARWDGATWSPLGRGLNDTVHALTTFDDGAGTALYAGGFFSLAGGDPVERIVRWDGAGWSPLGAGIDDIVYALAVFDDGAGPALYAGGSITSAGGVAVNNVARWDGAAWSPLGGGLSGTVAALTVYDDGGGPALYAGGYFTAADGVQANHVAKWDGAVWSPLGGGVRDAPNETVLALAVYDDGTGPALYAGGRFRFAGDVQATNIAKWDGVSWSGLGLGLWGDFHDSVDALAVFDDGMGPALYAGGSFDLANGTPASRIAKWDGTAWSPLGSGVNYDVWGLATFDDGTGPALFAGGRFTAAGGNPASRIAKWDGASWSPLRGGLGRGPLTTAGDFVVALTVFDDGTGPGLYAGGWFTQSPSGDAFLARWGCIEEPECLAELDGHAPVTAFDLQAYIDLWFERSPDAERTGDEPPRINAFDLQAYMEVWRVEKAARCGASDDNDGYGRPRRLEAGAGDRVGTSPALKAQRAKGP